MSQTKKDKKQKYLLTGMFLLLITSCSSPEKSLVDKLGNPVNKQNVYSNQTGLTDSLLQYAFYLPKGYNENENLPVLFFFDPHGDGAQPLEKYKILADNFGYIFIGSNNLKNGLSANYSSSVFESLYNEVNKRFAIDVNRIFSSGFSGGAKLAILFAQQYSYVAGVIACGASIPLVANYEPTYYYAGIIGSRDFNYLESNQTFALFDQKGYDYTSVLFNGGHEWPGITSFEMGMYGLEIYSIKTKKTSHTDVWLNALMNRLEDSITMQMQSNDLFAAHQTLRQYSRWFYGLKSIKEIHQQELAIQKNPEFADIIRKKQRLLKKEVSLRSDFIRAIELRDLEWWDAEIANIRKSICSEDIEVALVSHRLLNYLSMAAFMLTKTDLDDGRLDDARKKVTIYKLVDPDNPDAYLMEARFYMLIDDIPSMLESFKKSQQLGFNDYDTYKRESSWKDLMEQKEIQKLLE